MNILNTTEGTQVQYDHHPDICPQCHHALNPKYLSSTVAGKVNKHGARLEMAFKCTHRNCQSMFIGRYEQKGRNPNSLEPQGIFSLQESTPLKYKVPELSAEVTEISPAFKDIYEQACAAESYGLNEISGVGYRKALEFLVKDYCIHKDEENKEKIKSSFLGTVIKENVDDTNLKACAQRAAWLGNDETHYVRKWENKDISDLKVLINLSCVWVQSNILTEKYLAEMG